MTRKVGFSAVIILFVVLGRLSADILPDSLVDLRPQPEHSKSLVVTLNLLDQYHYRDLVFDDSLSSVVFDNYLSALDGSKSFFLKGDIDYFEKYRYQLDDELKGANLDFGYQLYTLYRERALERYSMVPEMLSEEFDFSIEEDYDYKAENKDWPVTRADLEEKWRKILKGQAINLKISGKEWDEIRDILQKRYDRVNLAIYQYNSEDVFSTYINSLTTAYDPHTYYFSPFQADDFEMRMSQSLEGIGARLSQQMDYTVVVEIVPGGPAFRGKELRKDDKIIGVAQGDDGEFIDVIGWRLDEVVQKIRGPKGSVVQLQILKGGDVTALPDTIRIVREKIKLEDEVATSEMIPIMEGNKTFNLGVITIPSFYADFEEMRKGVKDYKSTTNDVKKLITELESQGMDGLLIDLRYNGGGYLQEAIDLTGLFIERGPVVQVKNTDKSVEAHYDEDASQVFYEGPLALMTNGYSASASEIFSGAIQDYERGVILGDNTRGKGTVQQVIGLDRPVIGYLNRLIAHQQSFNRDVTELEKLRKDIQTGESRLGQLKITLAKFYRATGSSTQKIGVKPDILFPSPYDPEQFGESSQANALPWDEIDAEPFDKVGDVPEELVDQIYELYLSHLTNDPQMKRLVEQVNKQREDRENTSVSLNLEIRQQEAESNRNMDTEIEETEVFTSEEMSEKLSKDPYLKEALRLLAELTRRVG